MPPIKLVEYGLEAAAGALEHTVGVKGLAKEALDLLLANNIHQFPLYRKLAPTGLGVH